MELLKEFSFLFGRDRMKSAFKAVHRDMQSLYVEHEELKGSTNEWVMYLDRENRMLKAKILELENKLQCAEEEKISTLKEM